MGGVVGVPCLSKKATGGIAGREGGAEAQSVELCGEGRDFDVVSVFVFAVSVPWTRIAQSPKKRRRICSKFRSFVLADHQSR